jgi:hypothetical protein
MIALDHLVVAAPTLSAGVDWCRQTLGVDPAPGGRHALFGTHNRLLRIDSAAYPDAYLEIIAIDPDALPPARRRWFGFDDPGQRQQLAATGPRLIHWVARSDALAAHAQALIAVGLDPGAPVQAGRDTPQGPLRWQLLVRNDGALLHGGVVPTLIQWAGRHPCNDLPPSGVTLRALHLHGLPPAVVRALDPAGVTLDAAGAAGSGRLGAVLDTPRGPVTLGRVAPEGPER